MISLARKKGRREMAGFLVASGLLSFVVGMILLRLFFDSWPWAALVSGAAALFYVGASVSYEALSFWVYRRWNQVAKTLASLVRWWVSSIAFHVIVRVVGRSAGVASPEGLDSVRSFWRARGTLTSEAYTGQYNRVYRAEGEGWVGDYLKWCFVSGNGWMVFLLPFLLVLRAVSGERAPEVPDNVYTLY